MRVGVGASRPTSYPGSFTFTLSTLKHTSILWIIWQHKMHGPLMGPCYPSVAFKWLLCALLKGQVDFPGWEVQVLGTEDFDMWQLKHAKRP
eukprot:1158048-Pelagomonas_calceolata.AAC.14